MGDRHDYVALEWVRGAIAETLRLARQSLEAYAENPAQLTHLEHCLAEVHQVYGTLQMVEFYGAALMAEETERLLAALLAGAVRQEKDALAVLMQAILQLPPYLERVLSGRRDLPMVVLPLLNELRSARGESLLSETKLFTPYLPDAIPPVAGESLRRLQTPEFGALLRKLRQIYQSALVAIMRGQDEQRNLSFVARVLERLSLLSAQTPQAPLWEVAAALGEGLELNSIHLGSATRSLLARLERELHGLAELEGIGLNRPVTIELLKNILFYVAKAEGTGAKLQAVQTRYQLAEAWPSEDWLTAERSQLSGPDEQAMRSVVTALCEELMRLKDMLDLHVRVPSEVLPVPELLGTLKSLADTLAVLGFGQCRHWLLEQLTVVEQCVATDSELDQSQLTQLADTLIQVELELTTSVGGAPLEGGLAPSSTDLAQIHQVVFKEACQGLEQAKDAIIEFISSQWNHQCLERVPFLLGQARGGLYMVSLSRPAHLLDVCGRYIQEQLYDKQAVPSWQQLDTLADAITSVEYYLERLQEDYTAPAEHVLDMAETSLQQLGYEAGTPTLKHATIEPQPPLLSDVTLDCVVDEPESHSATTLAVEPQLDVSIVENIAPEAIVESLATITDTPDAFDWLPQELIVLPVPAADEESLDEDLQEVFVEEAGEVLETLAEYWPKWLADVANEKALVEFRRAFHTLKGSGRMMRALVIGELAWSVENLLNRVIDQTVTVTPALLTVVEQVLELLPELVAAFAQGQQAPHAKADLLASQAQALAKGFVPAEATSSQHSDALPEADSQDVAVESELDQQLVEIFRAEAETHLDTVQRYLSVCEYELPQPINDDLQRALHTLKGSAYMAGIEPIAQVAAPLEKMLREFKTQLISVDLSESELLRDAVKLMHQGVDQLSSTPFAPLSELPVFLERLQALQVQRLQEAEQRHDDEQDQRDPRVLVQFLAGSMDTLLHAEEGLEAWRSNASDLSPLNDLAIELDGLKDSARLAELEPIELLCADLAQVYKAVQRYGGRVTDSFFDRVHAGQEALLNMLDQLAAGLEVTADEAVTESVQRLLEEGELALRYQKPSPIRAGIEQHIVDAGGMLEPVAEQTVLPIVSESGQRIEVVNTPSIASLLRDDIDEAPCLAEAVSPYAMALDMGMADWTSLDHAVELLLQEPSSDEYSTVLLHLRNLQGLARVVGNQALERLSTQLLTTYQGLSQRLYVLNDGLREDLRAAQQGLQVQLQASLASQVEPDVEALVADLERSRLEAAPAVTSTDTAEAFTPVDEELVTIFLDEAFDVMEAAAHYLQQWQSTTPVSGALDGLLRALHTVKGGARMAEIKPVGDLAHELEFLYEDFVNERREVTAELLDLVQQCHDALNEMLEAAQQRQVMPSGHVLIRALKALRQDEIEEAVLETGVSLIDDVFSNDIVEPAGVADNELLPVDTMVSLETPLMAAEVVDILLEEAQEIVEQFDSQLTRWEASGALHIPEDVVRLAHTLKGGARLAGQGALADSAQDLEHLLVEAQQNGIISPDTFFAQLHQLYDVVQLRVQELALWLGAEGYDATRFSQPALAHDEFVTSALSTQPVPTLTQVVSPHLTVDSLPFVRRGQLLAAQQAQSQAPQELVRVSAELLENLVNLAGETSLFRGRIEQQVSDVGLTLAEMDTTIERVRDQLRRLDTETQAQILSRMQSAGDKEGYEEFDPLELDRHSQLQQLSRALLEAASDLADLKETLASRNRDAETLLLQQARVNTELQEGLMQTRMVPFERMVPRLRRIVRQVASELGKSVEFTVSNSEGEMDRTVLERMIAPLEHMLRNAIDHGVETAIERRLAAKPEQGSIHLALGREGADITLELSDDGAGIDVAAVRSKAIERGLISAETPLSDEQALQLILHSGLTTMEHVTQISGRGVGMDVVSSEIKQLGGSMHISSERGKGSRFKVRLPFTVSVNRALMVHCGDDVYAVPLNTIEGIVRVQPAELVAAYQQDNPTLDYAGQTYELRYLGELLGISQAPRSLPQGLPLPVLLVRSDDYMLAVHVDVLANSREIVVKSLGPQFAGVAGVSGATLLGDGRVVIILDLMASIRRRLQQRLEITPANDLALPIPEQRVLTVMVVDDSVTVRKVTSRFLERNGMHVLTAKDGVDAISQLQDARPDIMLLDVEMPRMDGYEVATLVRHDRELKDLPIIMITSRTGEKHRQRALSIGVNEYLGKPYQEAQLLSLIQQLVEADRGEP